MAGGKGSRMKLPIDKPMLKLLGKPMIQYVIDSFKSSKKIEEIICTVSKHTKETARYVLTQGIKVIWTSGSDFHEDLRESIIREGPRTYIVVTADMPLLSTSIVNKIQNIYEILKPPALTIAVPEDYCLNLRIKPSTILNYKGKSVVPSGISVLNGSFISESYIRESVIIIKDIRLALNVNTIDDLKIARSFLKIYACRSKYVNK